MIEGIEKKDILSFEIEKSIVEEKKVVGSFAKNSVSVELLNYDNAYSNLKGTYIKSLFGTIYIDDIEAVQENISIKLKGYDYTQKFDEIYDITKFTFPLSLKEWRNQICNLLEVDFEDNIFPNSDVILAEKPYIREKATYRDVIKMIAQAGASYAFVDYQDVLHFAWFDSTNNVEIKDWFELTTENTVIDPVNMVVIGRGDVEDNVVYPYTTPLSPKEFRIDSNEILNIDRKNMIIPIYDQVKNFKYVKYSMKTVGDFNVNMGSKIIYPDMYQNEYESYIMYQKLIFLGGDYTKKENYSIKYEAIELDETNTNYRFSESIEEKSNRTERLANKLDGIITDVVEEVGQHSLKISKVEQDVNSINQQVKQTYDFVDEASGYSLQLIDALDTQPLNFKIEGYTKPLSYLFPSENLYPSDSLYPCGIDEYTDTATGSEIILTDARNKGNITYLEVDGKTVDSNRNICPSQFEYWESGDYSMTDGSKEVNNNRLRLKELIKVNSNETYYVNTFSNNVVKFIFRTFDKDKKLVRSIGVANDTTKITMLENERYLAVSMYSGSSTEHIKYEQYKTYFQNKQIQPLICLDNESDKSFTPHPVNIGETGFLSLLIHTKNLLNVPRKYILIGYKELIVDLQIGTYTVSWKDIKTTGKSDTMLLYFYYDDNTTLAKYISQSYISKSLTFSTSKKVKKIGIYSQGNWNDSQSVTTTFEELMLEKNDKKTEYAEHQKQSIEIDLKKNKLCSQNEIQDKLFIKNNKIYFEKNVSVESKIVINLGLINDLSTYMDYTKIKLVNEVVETNLSVIYEKDINLRIKMSNSNDEKAVYINLYEPLRSLTDTHDELYIDAVGNTKINRKIQMDRYGVLRRLDLVKIEEVGMNKFNLLENKNYIFIENIDNYSLYCQYLNNTQMNKYYSTKMELNSTINQKADEITLEVNRKVDNEDLGTKISQNVEAVQIAWNQISQFFKFLSEQDNASLNIYDGNNQLLMRLNRFGQEFYYNNRKVGKMGTTLYKETDPTTGMDTSFNTMSTVLEEGAWIDWSVLKKDFHGDYYSMILRYADVDGGRFEIGGNTLMLGYADSTAILHNVYADTIYSPNVANSTVYDEIGLDTWNDRLYIYFKTRASQEKLAVMVDLSDARVKYNIEESSSNALDEINKIIHAQFDWKDGGNHQKFGYIAQQLESIDQNFVIRDYSKDNSLYQIDSLSILSASTKAIQELSEEVEYLKFQNKRIMKKLKMNDEKSNNKKNRLKEYNALKKYNLKKLKEYKE